MEYSSRPQGLLIMTSMHEHARLSISRHSKDAPSQATVTMKPADRVPVHPRRSICSAQRPRHAIEEEASAISAGLRASPGSATDHAP